MLGPWGRGGSGSIVGAGVVAILVSFQPDGRGLGATTGSSKLDAKELAVGLLLARRGERKSRGRKSRLPFSFTFLHPHRLPPCRKARAIFVAGKMKRLMFFCPRGRSWWFRRSSGSMVRRDMPSGMDRSDKAIGGVRQFNNRFFSLGRRPPTFFSV